MIEISFMAADGSHERAFTREGYTLMEAAVRAGVPNILAECGGACACATCHVVVDPAWVDIVGPPNTMEEQVLGLVEARQPASRLSCQVKLKPALDGLVVHVPDRK
jgi:2Fe-2S ferredoxin